MAATRKSPPMPDLGPSLAAFFRDAVGLEKTLRLVQFLSQTIVFLHVDDTKPWSRLRLEMNTARRYFRIFNWIGLAQVVWNLLTTQQVDIPNLLAILKAAFFGIHSFLELIALTEALEVTHTDWGADMLTHALEFWFYALFTSCLLETHKLLYPPAAPPPPKSPRRKSTATKAAVAKKTQRSYLGLFHAGCDLLIPGSLLGWIPVDPLLVGVAGSITSLLSIADVWAAVRKE